MRAVRSSLALRSVSIREDEEQGSIRSRLVSRTLFGTSLRHGLELCSGIEGVLGKY